MADEVNDALDHVVRSLRYLQRSLFEAGQDYVDKSEHVNQTTEALSAVVNQQNLDDVADALHQVRVSLAEWAAFGDRNLWKTKTFIAECSSLLEYVMEVERSLKDLA